MGSRTRARTRAGLGKKRSGATRSFILTSNDETYLYLERAGKTTRANDARINAE